MRRVTIRLGVSEMVTVDSVTVEFTTDFDLTDPEVREAFANNNFAVIAKGGNFSFVPFFNDNDRPKPKLVK